MIIITMIIIIIIIKDYLAKYPGKDIAVRPLASG